MRQCDREQQVDCDAMEDPQLIEHLLEEYCTTRGYRYVYGTAGFRDKASKLDTVMFTTGIIACLRSIALKGKPIGVMITASHNPPCDNGVKIVEPDGSMLIQSWEAKATDLANQVSNGDYKVTVHELSKLLAENTAYKPHLVLGRDSRSSGPHLLSCLLASAERLFKAKITNYGLLTTPQLHFLTNEISMIKGTGEIQESSYFDFFLNAWAIIMHLHNIENIPSIFKTLTIDTANGIGGPKVQELMAKWPLANRITLINNEWEKPHLLNHMCGADFVKTNQCLPHGISINSNHQDNLFCSFDGDADRVVFYYVDNAARFHLLDGDKIATLFAKFISQLLLDAKLQSELTMGVVQTAYANGSSTEYLKQKLNVPVTCAKTGVKHLHHEAITRYDIGIYFEANGHGTIVFSSKFHDIMSEEANNSTAAKTLKTLSQLINQTVGDAISDMMGVLAVLSILGWSPPVWNTEFIDLPNKLSKVIVPDRTVFVTTDQERKLLSPENLQEKIDAAVVQFDNGRSFVRASGTEDAVRVYAEAATIEQTEKLSAIVDSLVLESVKS